MKCSQARALATGLATALWLCTAGCGGGLEVNGVRITQGPAKGAMDPATVAEHSAGAIGVVITDTGRGLGFVIDPAGYMITNRHVVEDADTIEKVRFPGLADLPEFTDVEVVYIDPIRDLALLRLGTDDPLPFLELATNERAPVSDYVDESDPVVLLSREVGPSEAEALEEDPGLLGHTGRVERLEVYNATVGPGPFIGVSAQIQQGQSGGPVLDRFGRVIGVVTWTWKGQKGGFAVPISEAARMLAERPMLVTPQEQKARAQERARAYLAALGTGSMPELGRLTAPSRAREVRDVTIDVLVERSLEGTALRSFVVALEEVMAEAAETGRDPFAALSGMVGHTGTESFMRDLGVHGQMPEAAVIAFFYEVGEAYMSARWFGDAEGREALLVAFQRVHSLDAARNIALLDIIDALGGVHAELQSLEVFPGLESPQAVATVELGARGSGKKIAVQMRMEWGDWYVSEIQIAALGQDPEGNKSKASMDAVGVQSAPE